MRIHLDVFNPNSYDVAVRAVRGQVTLANRYPIAVDFQAEGEGVWLRSDATTRVVVPVNVPVQVALAVLRESYTTPTIPYHFTGRADVTATRSLRIEQDDYSVSADGWVLRQQIDSILAGSGVWPRLQSP
ncbi:LEA type 2 family protein [Myxococcota bacterium]